MEDYFYFGEDGKVDFTLPDDEIDGWKIRPGSTLKVRQNVWFLYFSKYAFQSMSVFHMDGCIGYVGIAL